MSEQTNLSSNLNFVDGEMIAVPGMIIPSYRQKLAKSKGFSKNALIYAIGGLGDVMCAEPAIRWAMKNYKDWEFSIATRHTELFRHLPVKEMFDLGKAPYPMSHWEKTHNCFCTLYPTRSFSTEFIVPMWTNVIDYHAIAMWRSQIPINQKQIILRPTEEETKKVFELRNRVVFHPGATWPSRTIPAWWWNELIQELNKYDIEPIIIGSTDNKRGTVEINPTGTLDMRNKLSIMESVALLQRSKHLVTNDSAPVHMAASGDKCFIHVFATVKQFDYLAHWRRNYYLTVEQGHKMRDIAKGGLYETLPLAPDYGAEEINFAECTDEQMKSWLPNPKDVSDFIRFYEGP